MPRRRDLGQGPRGVKAGHRVRGQGSLVRWSLRQVHRSYETKSSKVSEGVERKLCLTVCFISVHDHDDHDDMYET